MSTIGGMTTFCLSGILMDGPQNGLAPNGLNGARSHQKTGATHANRGIRTETALETPCRCGLCSGAFLLDCVRSRPNSGDLRAIWQVLDPRFSASLANARELDYA